MSRAATRRVFSELRTNLDQLMPQYAGKILCPLCFKVMPEEWIDLEEPLITEEHIIPEKLGGHLTTLTCKNCNSTHGTGLDSHLIQMIRAQDALEGSSARPLSGRLDLGEKQFPTHIILDAASKTVEFKMRKSHPSAPQETRRFFAENPPTEQNPLTISLQANLGYIPIRAFIALLRICFLAMFKQLGYSYVNSPAVDVIRQFIMNYERAPTDVGRLILRNIEPAPTHALQFVRISDVGTLVVMSLVSDGKSHSYATIMPNPELEPEKVFESLCDAVMTLIQRRPRNLS